MNSTNPAPVGLESGLG